MLKVLFFCCSLTCAIFCEISAFAIAEVPLKVFYNESFKNYPAVDSTVGPKSSLQWQRDQRARRYRTRLREAWNEAKAPNFAGHYFATHEIGCGTGCEVIFIVDWNTGKIFYPPQNQYFLVKKASRLLVLNPYDICTAYGPPILYEFTNEKFLPVKHSQCK